MKVIVCVDDNMGMMFGCSRQRRDSMVIRDIADYAGGKLRVDSYSKKLFDGGLADAVVSENPLKEAGADEYCFIESEDLSGYADKIEEVIIYRWNRRYPADLYFELDMGDFICTETTEFSGTSHERITKEVWRRAGKQG